MPLLKSKNSTGIQYTRLWCSTKQCQCKKPCIWYSSIYISMHKCNINDCTVHTMWQKQTIQKKYILAPLDRPHKVNTGYNTVHSHSTIEFTNFVWFFIYFE